ncbi:MAG: hypothetical protein AB7U85_03700 [Alphaproteobacteria bacterium]
MLKRLFSFLSILALVTIASNEARAHSAILGFISDQDDQDTLNEEKKYEYDRTDLIQNSLDEMKLIEKTYGTFSSDGLFDDVSTLKLELFRPIVPSDTSDTAASMADDPDAAAEKFISDIKVIFNSGNSVNYNEASKKKNQMSNLMSSMSYGQVVSVIEYNNKMKETIDKVIEAVNQCKTIDCTIKHANKLDLMYNNLLVAQLFLMAGNSERSGFSSLVATSDPESLATKSE